MSLCKYCKGSQTRSSCTVNKEGQHHSINNRPAITLKDGSKYWFKNGKNHRKYGPASILGDGSKYWYQDGNIHNELGPAFIHSAGQTRWYLEGREYLESDWKTVVGKSKHTPP